MRSRHFHPGLALAAVVLLLDQASKILLLEAFRVPIFERPPSYAPGPSVEILPFFNLSLVWNWGVSFGLLQGDAPWQRWVLILFVVVVTGGLVVWLARVEDRGTGLAIGAVIGGALGNLIDRVFYGAVVDFVDLHAFGYHWYVFNLADSAIVLGVAGLLYVSFFGAGRSKGWNG
ncbi:MAG: signal peptidase II [Alphaproteobacteria bacterium]|nr:signal peptidase II [Alphaproteobacteria bacterium]